MSANQKHRTDEIEHLFKDSKQYSVIKNLPQLKKLNVWTVLEFPGTLKSNGQYQLIPGFVGCFNCSKILSYGSSTKYVYKHRCLNSNAFLFSILFYVT